MSLAAALSVLAAAAPRQPPGALTRAVQHIDAWLDFRLLDAGGIRITVGSLIGAVIVVVLFMALSRLVRSLLRRFAQRNAHVNRSAVYTVERLAHYALLIVGVLLAMNVLNIPVAKFAIFAGALGVGLGFGLQAIFNNFVSGLVLLFERSLKVGDFVELASGVHGTVRDIYIRATRITTNDDIDILVPNSEFVTGRVVNWTLREAYRRLKVPFGVAYGTDKERVKLAALEAAREVPFTLVHEGKRGPQVWLTGFGDSSLDFQLVVWLTPEATRRPGAVTAAYNWALHTALEKYGIEIPFPQRDIHVRSWTHPDADVDPPPLPSAPRLAENDAVRDVERDIAESAGQSGDVSPPPADAKR